MTSPSEFLQRIGLGTAQFGLDYGITNSNGTLSRTAAAEILDRALPLGIRLLDTAPAYGPSEEVIGQLDNACQFDLVTKVPPVPAGISGADKADSVERDFDASLERLRRDSIEGLLVHHGQQLTSRDGDHLIERLMKIRNDGRVKKVGASVYLAGEIDDILARFRPDIIQLPISIADQRLIESGHIDKLKSSGIEVHARSLFLQGALLAKPFALPDFFQPHQEEIRRIAERASELHLTSLALCLAFANQTQALDRLIIGVSSVSEFQEIVAAANTVAGLVCDLDGLAFSNHAILDPSGWPSE